MHRWPAIALVLMLTACGTAANDIVASDPVPRGTQAADAEPDTNSNDDERLLSPAGTTTEPAPTATVATSSSTTAATAPTTTSPTATPPAAQQDVDSSPPAEQQPESDPEPVALADDESTEPSSASAASSLGDQVFELAGCPDAPRAAVTDKAAQRYWLCMDGQAVTPEIPMTTASENYGLPPVSTYPVFAREENATGINGEPLERFVAFYTTSRNNRIAFHEVVDQDPATVGDLDQRGSSAGCFRVREADSIQVWEFLQIGDPVVVITN